MKYKTNIFNRNIVFVLLFLQLLFVFVSCHKPNEYIWVKYDETYCADAWTYNSTDEILKDNVVAYFKTKDISIYDIEIFVSKDAELSNTCSNSTGRVIKCKIKNKNLSSMKGSGFYE